MYSRCSKDSTVFEYSFKNCAIFLFTQEEQNPGGGSVRFSVLWRLIPRVSKKALPERLGQLEADGLITRQEQNDYPPEVSDALSERGSSLVQGLDQLEAWARCHLSNVFVPEHSPAGQ